MKWLLKVSTKFRRLKTNFTVQIFIVQILLYIAKISLLSATMHLQYAKAIKTANIKDDLMKHTRYFTILTFSS